MDIFPQTSVLPKNKEVISLDMKDRRILFALSQNARVPQSEIAARVKLSRDAVSYRIQGYFRNGILKGTVTVVNVDKLGYDAYHIFMRLNNPSREVEESIVKEISSMPFVRAILKFFGSYDFEIAAIARNPKEFDGILTKILSTAKDAIQEYEIMIITKVYLVGSLTKSFSEDFAEDMAFKPERQKENKYVPDKTDFEIIKTIRDDARLPSIVIGEKIGLSQDAVSYRIKKLMQGLVLFIPVVNYQRIGYTIHALMLNISPYDEKTETKLKNFFSNNPHILWAVKTLGKFNVLAYICTKTESELQDTIRLLREEFPDNIKRYESLLAIEEYKYTYAPDCLFE